MNQQILDSVRQALNPRPERAELIALRANVSRGQAYQALVHLYDCGLAFLVHGDQGRRIEGWQS